GVVLPRAGGVGGAAVRVARCTGSRVAGRAGVEAHLEDAAIGIAVAGVDGVAAVDVEALVAGDAPEMGALGLGAGDAAVGAAALRGAPPPPRPPGLPAARPAVAAPRAAAGAPPQRDAPHCDDNPPRPYGQRHRTARSQRTPLLPHPHGTPQLTVYPTRLAQCR